MSLNPDKQTTKGPSEDLRELTGRTRPACDAVIFERAQSALRSIPGGSALDDYFGLTTGKPKQPRQEARRTLTSLTGLLRAETPAVAAAALAEISKVAGSSGANVDALRALRRRPVNQG